MLASDILGWTTIVGAATAAKLPLATCPVTEPRSDCPIVRQTTGARCGLRGTLKSNQVNVVQPACTTDNDIGCAQQCLETRTCQSYAFNPLKKSCTLYGKTLQGQGFVKTQTGRTKFYSSTCYDYQCPTPDPVYGPNLVANPSFRGGNVDWTYENDDDVASDNAMCYAISDPGYDLDYMNLYCSGSSAQEATFTVTQPLTDLDVFATYELSFALGYKVYQDNLEAAFDSGNTPGYRVSLGGIEVAGGSVCNDGVDAGNDSRCLTTSGDHWRLVGPIQVSAFSPDSELKFEFTERYWGITLDAVDLHTVS